MHHAFLYISSPTLRDYDLKPPNFKFWGGREHKTTTLPFFSWTFIESFRSQPPPPLKKIRQHLKNWTRLNKREKLWSSANTLFKWRFSSRRRRRRCCLMGASRRGLSRGGGAHIWKRVHIELWPHVTDLKRIDWGKIRGLGSSQEVAY